MSEAERRIAAAERAYTRMLEQLAQYGNEPTAIAKRSAMRVIIGALRGDTHHD